MNIMKKEERKRLLKEKKNEAVKHAQRILKENNHLRKTLDEGEAVLVEQVKGKTRCNDRSCKKRIQRGL